MRVDQVILTRVPNLDNSGDDYRIEYLEDFVEGSPISIGHCDLYSGCIRFDIVHDDARLIGVYYRVIKLLAQWIEENVEE